MVHACLVSLWQLVLSGLSLHIGVQAVLLEVPILKELSVAIRPYFDSAVADAAEAEAVTSSDVPFPSELTLKVDEDQLVPKSVGTCDAVALRWRSFEMPMWPVERFVLQRYPNGEHQPQWSTLLDENASELVDQNVQSGRRYAYRVQAICRDNVSSAYEYQWVQLDDIKSGSSSRCRASSSLLSSVDTLTVEEVRYLGIIFACFLTVYGLMRVSVMGVQGTQSRSSRLKQIEKSMAEGEGIVAAPVSIGHGVSMVPRQSSTSTSSSSSSVDGDLSLRGSMPDAIPISTTSSARGLTRTLSCSGPMVRSQSVQLPIRSSFRPMSHSISTIREKATECGHCGKRFGLFRKQYMCDICHSVALCRKCGYRASVDSFAHAHTGLHAGSEGNTRASAGDYGAGRRRSIVDQHQQKKLKVRTICRTCCDDVYRYSARASDRRPSYMAAAM
uniref:Fibronectin type-III domain-containing protein n=1 Tax=Hyaloperonospora arabidopsidis (strain Emoy2) TaxID=559515 RepID=M4BRZ1_HYAAE